MSIKLNLLPKELLVDPKLAKVYKIGKAMGLILTAFFIVFSLGAILFFVISNISLSNNKKQVESLKASVVALETSEQKMVLLKDRLNKISGIYKKPSSISNLNLVTPFIINKEENTSILNLDIDSSKIILDVSFKSTASMTTFFETLKNSKDFKNVTLTSFGYNPSIGYLAVFSMIGK